MNFVRNAGIALQEEVSVALSLSMPAGRKKAGQAFQLRGTMQTVLCLRLLDLDIEGWHDKLLEQVAHAPDFFHRAPIVIDVAGCIDADPGELAGILDRMRDMKLVPVGLQNGNDAWNDRASELGLAIFTGQAETKSTPPKATKPAEAPKPAPTKPVRAKTMHIKTPIRGGQQVIGQADMIVTAPVSPGAEVAAPGNVHIYAPLRGRVFAGVEGDENAMIFCDQLNAELVSVAGVHKVNEEMDVAVLGKRCRIYLVDQELKIDVLS